MKTMRELKAKLIGTKSYGNKPVTATDPCYDEGTWCTEVIDIEPGEYTCVAWIPVDEIVSIARCGIYRDGIISPIAHREHVGTIGVDGGLAGFYQGKPNYRDAEWKEFCDKLKKNERSYFLNGFV